MKDFERFLTDLRKPDVEVPAFRDQLRRELLSRPAARGGFALRFALAATVGLAAFLGMVLVLFVARPAIPEGIHAALTGSSARGLTPAVMAAPDAREQRGAVQRASMPIAADRSFVEAWSAERGTAVSVRSVEAERMFTVRQFELTDGKRMLVFTELGDEGAKPAAVPATRTEHVF